MFESFELSKINTGEVTVRVRHGGSGQPLLLLHGHPQTHAMWHKVAPRLAQEYSVFCPDLRGYGESSKPPTTPDHEPYSKRTMARDQIALMHHFGFERFSVVGHDRGARCGYRLALDFPRQIEKLALLDIVPTGEAFRRTEMNFAMSYWHWFFLSQPYPLPEDLLTASPDSYYFRNNRDLFDPEALADYLRCVYDPATIHAMCEDYRAGATYDYQLDESERGKRTIACPTLVLWGSRGPLGKLYDVMEIWKAWCVDVRGGPVDSGHYLAEEAPDETLKALLPFLAER